MNCESYRDGLIELARSGASEPEARWHADGCAECSRFLERQRALSRALASLAGEAAEASVPGAVEARLLEEMAGPGGPARTWRSAPRWTAAFAALAASLAAILLLRAPAPAPRSAAALFIQVPYVVPPAPYERTAVMRMDVPVAALIAAGFEVHIPDAGGAVRADVLVGQDGRALAIRLVPGLISNSERRLN